MTAAILVLNAGSSSLKFGLYERGSLAMLCRGGVGGIGEGPDFAAAGRRAGDLGTGEPEGSDHEAITRWLLGRIRARLPDLEVAAAGHRVVHGGTRFGAPVRLDAEAMAALEALTPLAPGHQPFNLVGIRAVAAFWPDLPQVACFDTGFHRTQPRLAQLFALPRAFAEEGILRYGFHGLSYEYVARLLPELAGEPAEGRVIVAHLGHGASLCAMQGRRSVATTMGFTALDGLMMGTRSGSLDPGLVLHLLRHRGLGADELEDVLYNRSGLLGISGISGDARALEASADPRAAEALELFAYRAAREAGSLVAALGGLDLLVFTAGIGEHSARIRRAICGWLGFVGIELDEEANEAHARRISAPGSAVTVMVVPTDEEIIIAEHTRALLGP
ncbi:MAG TPA: acetate/propionate family kinase [Paracoccaceae bacterium]|nr:acetate/propionate family kinase [Paracoccaceae bacterium]